MKPEISNLRLLVVTGLALAGLTDSQTLRADEVSDWNQNMFTAVTCIV